MASFDGSYGSVSTPPPSTTSSPVGPLTLPSSLPPHNPDSLFPLLQLIIKHVFIFLTVLQFIFSVLLYRSLNRYHPSIHRSIPITLLFTCSFGFVSKLMMLPAMWISESNEFGGKVCGLVSEALEWFWTVGEVFLVYYLMKGFIGRAVDRQRLSRSSVSSSGSTLWSESHSEAMKTKRTEFQNTFRVYAWLWVLVSLTTLGVRFPWFDITTGVMNTPYGGFPRSLSPPILLRGMLCFNVLVGVVISAYLTFKTKGVRFDEGRYLTGSRRSVPKPLLFLAPLLLLRYIYEVLQLVLLSFVWTPEGTFPIGDGDEWATASIVVLGVLDFLIIQLSIAVARRMVLDRVNASRVSDGSGGVGVDINESERGIGERDVPVEMKPVRLRSRDHDKTKRGKFYRDPYAMGWTLNY
ncbi:hypothetical protein BDN72DRAFT_207471 [Pluteus cervinus]|uniref:Uncharacterized protein n=1 Tax=Pluteus cervinus TaxID=181527 RepID=A0ACD3AHH3_9AGAR|nr:hypothetical protein BDN72DRAFT_207471 [Pluteus cervinus]